MADASGVRSVTSSAWDHDPAFCRYTDSDGAVFIGPWVRTVAYTEGRMEIEFSKVPGVDRFLSWEAVVASGRVVPEKEITLGPGRTWHWEHANG